VTARRLLAVVALVAVLPAACGGPEDRVTGVVVDVDGDLTGVEAFVVVTTGGERLRFVPDEDLTRFEHGAPLAHLTEHLRTGDPVRVTFVTEGATLVALEIEDAGGS
jgi:hypothetical protein